VHKLSWLRGCNLRLDPGGRSLLYAPNDQDRLIVQLRPEGEGGIQDVLRKFGEWSTTVRSDRFFHPLYAEFFPVFVADLQNPVGRIVGNPEP